jgi:hypothetical protein
VLGLAIETRYFRPELPPLLEPGNWPVPAEQDVALRNIGDPPRELRFAEDAQPGPSDPAAAPAQRRKEQSSSAQSASPAAPPRADIAVRAALPADTEAARFSLDVDMVVHAIAELFEQLGEAWQKFIASLEG